jgi:hypothetical protein
MSKRKPMALPLAVSAAPRIAPGRHLACLKTTTTTLQFSSPLARPVKMICEAFEKLQGFCVAFFCFSLFGCSAISRTRPCRAASRCHCNAPYHYPGTLTSCHFLILLQVDSLSSVWQYPCAPSNPLQRSQDTPCLESTHADPQPYSSCPNRLIDPCSSSQKRLGNHGEPAVCRWWLLLGCSRVGEGSRIFLRFLVPPRSSSCAWLDIQHFEVRNELLLQA